MNTHDFGDKGTSFRALADLLQADSNCLSGMTFIIPITSLCGLCEEPRKQPAL